MSRCLHLLGAMLLLVIFGCDPVVRFQPVAWEKDEAGRWQFLEEGILFECRGISAFPGADFIAQTFWIKAIEDTEILIDRVGLKIGDQTIYADRQAEGYWKIDQKGRIDPSFDISHIAIERQYLLTVEIHYSASDEHSVMRVDFVRE